MIVVSQSSTHAVLKLINLQFNLDEWRDVGQGWTGREDTLRLMGWSKPRRVVVIRRARKIDPETGIKAVLAVSTVAVELPHVLELVRRVAH